VVQSDKGPLPILLLSVVAGSIVHKYSNLWEGMLLDVAKCVFYLVHNVGRLHLWRRGQMLQDKLIRLLQHYVGTAEGFVVEWADS